MALNVPTPGSSSGIWGAQLNEVLNGTGPGTLSATYATAQVVAQALSTSTVSNNTATEVPLCAFALPDDTAPGDAFEIHAPGALGHTLSSPANMILRMWVGDGASMETPVLSLPPSAQPYRFILRGTVYIGESGNTIFDMTLNVGEALSTRLNGSLINLAGVATASGVGAGTIVKVTAQIFTAFGYAQMLRSALRRRARSATVTHLFNAATITRGGLTAQVSSPSKEWNAKNIAPEVDRFEIRSGDYQQSDGALKERIEVYRDPVAFGVDQWLAYSLYIEPGTTSTADWCVLGQAHRTFDAADVVTSPPLAFNLVGTDLTCETRSDPADPSVSQPDPVIRYTLTNLARGQWHNFVHRMTFARTGNGYLKSWHNGTLMHDAAIPLGMNDAGGPYWKWGIYRDAAAETLAVRYANVEGFQTASLAARVTDPLPIAP